MLRRLSAGDWLIMGATWFGTDKVLHSFGASTLLRWLGSLAATLLIVWLLLPVRREE